MLHINKPKTSSKEKIMKRLNFSENIKNYKWRSIFFKHLITSFLIMAIPMIIVCLSITAFYVNATKKNFEKEAEIVNSDISTSFEDMHTNLYEIYVSLTSDTNFKNYLTTTEATDATSLYKNAIATMSTITSYTNTIDEISAIHVYNPATNYVLSTRAPAPLDSFYDLSWYTEYINNNGNDLEYVTFNAAMSNMPVYGIVKNIYIDNIHRGVIVFCIDVNTFYSALTGQNPNIVNTVVTYNDRIVIHKNNNYIGTKYKEDALENPLSNTVNITSLDNYTIITEMKNSISGDIRFYITIITVILIIMLISILISSYLFSINYYKDTLEVIAILNEADDTDDTNINEIQSISNNVLALVTQKKQIKHQLEENLALLRKSQLYTLQQQINPHFIFNTLNMIVSIDRMTNKRSTEISRIILLLADILRFNFRNPNYIISFKDELDNTKKYMELQNLRYKNKFEFICDIEPELLEESVLKFMLQPLVENSIMHGILTKTSKDGTICINAFKDDKNFVVTVSDNGIGIPENKLKILNSLLETEEINEEFIGISNVNQRIKLVFGKAYGLSVTSDSEGTMISISLPIGN